MLALENNNSEPIYYKAPLDGLYTVVEHTKLYKVYYVNEQDWDDSASYYIMKDEVSV